MFRRNSRDHDNGSDQQPNNKNTKLGSGSMGPGDQGNSYQKRWSLYLALLAFETGKAFVIRFERRDAGALDDISLEIDDNIYFVQVKHTSIEGKITEGMLTKETGVFSLLKYYKSWQIILLNNSTKNWLNLHSILLTKHALQEKSKIMFKNTPSTSSWVKFLGKDSNAGKGCKSLKNVNQFKNLDANFLKQFIIMPEQQSLEELVKSIEDLLKKRFKNNSETLFLMLATEIERLIQFEDKQSKPRDRKWLEELFEQILAKKYLGIFTYMFEDSKQKYSQIKIASPKTGMSKMRAIMILPYKKFYHLRMMQVQAMVRTGEYWYIPLDKMHTNLEHDVLSGLEMCTTDRTLILLDFDNNESMSFIENIVKKSSKSITNLVIITNRDTNIIRTILDPYWSSKGWEIQSDVDITLADLQWDKSSHYCYKVKFQGQDVPFRDLPSFEKVKVELAGDFLEEFIQTETLVVGMVLPGREQSHYEPRQLEPIEFEIDFDKIKADPGYDHEFTVFKQQSRKKDMPKLNVIDLTVHYTSKSSKGKCVWLKSVPRCKTTIENCLKNDFKSFCKMYDTIDQYVKPRTLSGHAEIDEQRFVEDLSTDKDKKLVIIGGETGTGKSTTMKWLAQHYKEKHPLKWVLFINFSGHPLVDGEHYNEEIEDNFIKQVLLTAVTDQENEFVGRYFKRCSNDDIVLFIDSFDEVCQQHVVRSFKIIEKLTAMNFHRIVISSRQYVEFMLFNHFPQCKIYHLVPLDHAKQQNILNTLVQAANEISTDTSAKLLKSLQNELRMHEFQIGEPLVVSMLAHIVSNNPSKIKIHPFTIFDLFEQFIDSFLTRTAKDKCTYGNEDNLTIKSIETQKCIFYEKLGDSSLKEKLQKDKFIKAVQKTSRKSLENCNIKIDIVNGLTNPNLKHGSFQHFFFAYSMQKRYIDIESEVFWDVFGDFLEANSLTRYFFMHQLSKWLYAMAVITDSDCDQCKALFEEMKRKSNMNQLSKKERNLPGLRKLLTQIKCHDSKSS